MIRNSILRTDVFPDSIRNLLRLDLKKYLEARIDYYNYATDLDKFGKAKDDARTAAKSLWATTERQTFLPNTMGASNNMFASLTTMFDMAARRDAMLVSGIPEIITHTLFFLALIISFIGGFTTPVIKPKEWFVITGFILLATIIIYITLNLERPMRGLIKPNVGEDRMIELRKFF